MTRTEAWVWSGDVIPRPSGYDFAKAIIISAITVNAIEAFDKDLNIKPYVVVPISACTMSDNSTAACTGRNSVGVGLTVDYYGRINAQSSPYRRTPYDLKFNNGDKDIAAGGWDWCRLQIKFVIFWFK